MTGLTENEDSAFASGIGFLEKLWNSICTDNQAGPPCSSLPNGSVTWAHQWLQVLDYLVYHLIVTKDRSPKLWLSG